MGANLLSSMADSSWFVEVGLVKCYYDVLILKSHAKWVVYLHINMIAVDVHNYLPTMYELSIAINGL